MADKKISQLPAATLPLAGTELLPIVQSGTTDNITVNNLAVGNIKSNATTGVLQVTGPAAASTRVMTTPDANFTVARTDAGQTFTGNQNVAGTVTVSQPSVTSFIAYDSSNAAADIGGSVYFGGSYTGTTPTSWAFIKGGKESATDGNYAGYLSFATRPNGSANTEAMRISSAQNVTVTAGNLVIGTSGKGITTSATDGNINIQTNGHGSVNINSATTISNGMNYALFGAVGYQYTNFIASAAGVTASLSTGQTANTFDFAGYGGYGIFMAVGSDPATPWRAATLVWSNGAALTLTSLASSNITVGSSGTIITVTNTSGSAEAISWSFLRLG